MNNFYKLLSFSILALAICVTGCGDKVKVTGKVTFSDGAPLTVGTVCFTNGNDLFKGEIQQDGSYEMRTFKPGDKIKKGSYKVYLANTIMLESGKTQTIKSGEDGKDEMSWEVVGRNKSMLDPKYNDPEKSGLTIDATKNMTYDIVVE